MHYGGDEMLEHLYAFSVFLGKLDDFLKLGVTCLTEIQSCTDAVETMIKRATEAWSGPALKAWQNCPSRHAFEAERRQGTVHDFTGFHATAFKAFAGDMQTKQQLEMATAVFSACPDFSLLNSTECLRCMAYSSSIPPLARPLRSKSRRSDRFPPE